MSINDKDDAAFLPATKTGNHSVNRVFAQKREEYYDADALQLARFSVKPCIVEEVIVA